jgi:hypothetical protein
MIEETLLNLLANSQQISKTLESSPQPTKPIITQSDADRGFITRYFVRQTNDNTFILEVDSKQYTRFKENPRFITAEVKWKIVGKLDTIKYTNGANLYGIKDLNRIAVADADLTFGGLRNYIIDYAEYWLREN